MKKILSASLIFIMLIVVCISLFMPSKIHFRTSMYVRTSPNSASRFILDQKAWHNWWPSHLKNKNDSLFLYKQFEYAVNWKMISGDSIRIKTKHGYVYSLINTIPVNLDSIGLQWEGESMPEKNIFKKVRNYFTQNKLQNNADEIFKAVKVFLENDEKVYGISIEHKMVVDTLLISTKKTFDSYPNNEQVYDLIADLKTYINNNGVLQTNPPMLHVVKDSGTFKTMVALPINKFIPNTDKFVIKKMVAGKILITEVKGGSSIAEATIKKVELYMDDYHLMAPAISFQSLVTDRLKERDSTKWVTKIYYPIM